MVTLRSYRWRGYDRRFQPRRHPLGLGVGLTKRNRPRLGSFYGDELTAGRGSRQAYRTASTYLTLMQTVTLTFVILPDSQQPSSPNAKAERLNASVRLGTLHRFCKQQTHRQSLDANRRFAETGNRWDGG